MTLYKEKEVLKIAQKIEDEFQTLYKLPERIEPWKGYLVPVQKYLILNIYLSNIKLIFIF
ncbi:hypothetical protein [Fluviispira sanaruensis]|uniref:Uncharacterized protein n=1 Tax=Fluviispira sanaruensis TaxID=2493639 RepID=A0A4P2VKY0_FLUSA|nr:hypothetical protein [Fluviispira sanaruensis]BBH53983.1 hypothetical protein JCM31447_24370 [Fluviispira sanaruensis]